MAYGEPWTDADDALLAQLWTLGMSASRIASKIGRSRNAILGRAHRINLAARRSPIPKRPASAALPAGRSCQWIEGEPAADTFIAWRRLQK